MAMNIEELVKAVKITFEVESVTVSDINKLKARITELVNTGMPEGEAAAQGAVEIFGKSDRKKKLVEGGILKKGWDLSWFRANSKEFIRSIDDYFRNK